jgi:hypothetical protein
MENKMSTEKQVAQFIKNLLNLFPYFKPTDSMGFIKLLEESIKQFSYQTLLFSLQEIKETHNNYFPTIPEIVQICFRNIIPPSGYIQITRDRLIKEYSEGIFNENDYEKFICYLERNGKIYAAENMKKRMQHYKSHFHHEQHCYILDQVEMLM